MEYKITNTGAYLLIVDDSEIKKETYCYDSINNILVFYKGSMKNIGFQKVISHLPLNNSPILEGVPELPPLEDDSFNDIHFGHLRNVDIDSFYKGYIKAKEKYSKPIPNWVYENLCYYDKRNPISAPLIEDDNDIERKCSCDNCFNGRTNMAEFIINSLQQQKMPVGFKCEMEVLGRQIIETEKIIVEWQPISEIDYMPKIKTTTNSQGLTQWVGEYIY